MKQLSAIDLFAGGGGLTVGLKRAGFSVASAVEVDKHAYSTYRANHPEVEALCQDIRDVHGKDLASKVGSRVDLVSGCPPCQGFTSLTSKYETRDPRNGLVKEMLRLIGEIRPKAVMMENVPGLEVRGKYQLSRFLTGLRKLGYVPTSDVLQVADFGVPQFRRRLVILAGHKFKIDMPKPTHSRDGDSGLRPWLTVRDAIRGMPKPKTLAQVKESGSPEMTDWHIVRSLSPENEKRIRAARPGKSWWSIPTRLRPECHQSSYRGFGNVYGRMRWSEVSPTITGGCTTLSKGRFGHPSANRTISVREAALLQTFPVDYRIDTPFMDRACDIIGNALPCLFAEVLAKQCRRAILRAEAI